MRSLGDRVSGRRAASEEAGTSTVVALGGAARDPVAPKSYVERLGKVVTPRRDAVSCAWPVQECPVNSSQNAF